MNAVIRVDASVEIGIGHVMRSLTLAHQLKKYNFNILFVCRQLLGNQISLIINNGFKVYELSKVNLEGQSTFSWYKEHWKEDSIEIISILNEENIKSDILIVDHYGLDEKWEFALTPYTKKIMVIDDLANRKHKCDILFDQNFYKDYRNRYNILVPNDCEKLLGPNYVLLREEFFEAFKSRKVRHGIPTKLLVFFGGTDPTNETLKSLKALALLKNIQVDVITGTSNPKKTEIEVFCQKHSDFTFYCQVSNMAELMNKADLSIGAGGTSTWERCYLGLPSVTIMIAENQVELTEAVGDYGATINLGMSNQVTVYDIFVCIKELINNPKQLRALSARALKLVDHEIVNTRPVTRKIMEALK